MGSVNRRTFAKLTAAAAVTAVAPLLVGDLVAGAPSGAGRRSALAIASQRSEAPGDTLRSELLMDLTLETQTPHEIAGAGGGRLVVPVSGGMFEGPRLKGTIVSPGGDWMRERPDGSRLLDVRILLQTDDAQTIYVSWGGVAFTPPGGKLFARILPVFETGAPAYRWLNNVVAVGVYRGGPEIAYRVYQIL